MNRENKQGWNPYIAGALLLKDMTIIKFMVTSILVAMVGVRLPRQPSWEKTSSGD